MMDKNSPDSFVDSAQKLSGIVDKLDRDFTARRTWQYSLWHGMLQGMGVALGATVLFVIIFYGLVALEASPVVGNFASKVIDQLFVNDELSQ